MQLFDHLSLRTLKLLAVISECGSLTQAAGRLHIVPSAASRRVRALEEALGFTLVQRTAKGVELTPSGQKLAAYAGRLEYDLQALATELIDMSTGVLGRVTLSASASAIAQHLPEDLGRFMRGHPNIRVDLKEHFSAEIVQKLHDNETDVGIIVAPEATLPNLNLRPYRHETLRAVLPANHPLGQRQSVTLDDLIDEVWVGLPAGTSLAALLHSEAGKRGAALRVRIEVHGIESACRMVQNELGITLLPDKALASLQSLQGIISLPLEEPWARRTLYVATLAEVPLEPAAVALVRALTGGHGDDDPP